MNCPLYQCGEGSCKTPGYCTIKGPSETHTHFSLAFDPCLAEACRNATEIELNFNYFLTGISKTSHCWVFLFFHNNNANTCKMSCENKWEIFKKHFNKVLYYMSHMDDGKNWFLQINIFLIYLNLSFNSN